MAEPPKPKKGGPQDLHEVERALSVLQGRHPEHERARREDEEARRRRVAEQDTFAHQESKRVRSRRVLLIGVAAPIVALFAFIGVFGKREMARRARIDAVSESFRSYGFVPVDTSLRSATGMVDASVEPGCLLAVSTGQRLVTIARGGTTATAVPPALFCTCSAEHITVTSPVGGHGGIALLRADTAEIGGSQAFAFASWKPASTLVTDEACSDASLDAWITAKHFPQPAVTDDWLSAPERRPLVEAGFHVVTTGNADAPFVVADAPGASCVVVTSSANDALSVRRRGETTPVATGQGALARCAQGADTFVISRTGKGTVTVLVASAAKVGGSFGLRALAASAKLTLSTVAVSSADRPWDAKQLLVASAIPEGSVTTATTPDVAADPEARIVALSFETSRALISDTAADVRSSCLPPLDDQTRQTLCIFSGPQRWRSPGTGEGASGGLARSKLPFWLYSMQSAKDPAALTGLLKLLGLARVLLRQGFQPTTLDALTERPNGVEVLGRTGEDAVVAVGVGPTEPWVYPLSEDAPWELDGTPQLAMVKPLQKVMLVTNVKKLPPVSTRRTVVFRRQAKATP